MLIRNFLLTLVLMGCAFGQGLTGMASFTRDSSFPPVGLASSETAQINLVNVATMSMNANPVAPSCAGTITFTGAGGTTIGSPVPFTTVGGQVFSTQLAFSKLSATGNRGEFVASIQATTTIPAKAPCSLVFSLETFDNTTGATHVFLQNSVISGGPIPVLSFGPGNGGH